MSGSEGEVVRRTKELIVRARRVVPEYGGPAAPLDTRQLRRLASAFQVRIVLFPFQSSLTAMALPPFRGAHPILLNRHHARAHLGFAIRHELAHVIAGEVDDRIVLHEAGYMTDSERAADLFALADLIPDSDLNAHFSRIEPEDSVLSASIQIFTQEWPADRIADRARLRMRLHELNHRLATAL